MPAFATHPIESGSHPNRGLSLRGFHPPRLQPAPFDQSADCGLITPLFRRSTPLFRRSPLRLFSLARVEVDVRVLGGFSILLLSLASVRAQDGGPFRVEINLQQQAAFLIRGRGLVLESPISSGRYGHLTQPGSFKVIEKQINHYSSIYGKIVDANGNTIV